ncbi:MAG: alpha-L-fucosidase [Muribaculaceae bacterium]|nr:alpha-L-fucosidase [Muribaculaceae bacterium]MDE7141831.1 alpha-L-fucosidase [Muribaculaceae bacterium]
MNRFFILSVLPVLTIPFSLSANNIEVSEDFGQAAVIDSLAAGFEFDIAPGPYAPTYESFEENYQCPAWFRDDKFGIYMHWGLNSVAGFNGHYARWMYYGQEPDSVTRSNIMCGYRPIARSVYDYHVSHFGHPSEFGYKDFIPLWKPTRFNPDSLAAIYKRIGARFIGVMAVHHDNFDLFDSPGQPWNSVNMGPHIDIVGAWRDAAEKAGLRFAITSHMSNYCHEHAFYQGPTADADGPYAGIPYDYNNPEYAGLYGERTDDRLMRLQPGFAKNWYARTRCLIDKYHPDLLYFDGPLPEGMFGRNIAAHFYNLSRDKHGSQQGVLTIKRRHPGLTLTHECSCPDSIYPEPFLYETSINPGWFYLGQDIVSSAAAADAGQDGIAKTDTPDQLRMTAGQTIDMLCDIVSKNGTMMLNVGLRPDGSLPETYLAELEKIGDWLRTNGEAIFDTRPYRVYGEGSFNPSAQKKAYFDNRIHFGSDEIRYTTKPGTIYAILLDWPVGSDIIELKALAEDESLDIESVTYLPTRDAIEWRREDGRLTVKLPSVRATHSAFPFKITLRP